MKECPRCKKYYKDSLFNARYVKKKTTSMCFKCRFRNAARFASSEQHSKELIWDRLYTENIKKTHVYYIYLKQERCCLLCFRRVTIPLMYINKIEIDQPYRNNMFLSCIYCYNLREDYNIKEFKEKIKISNYPFNKSQIRHSPRKTSKTITHELFG